MDQRTYMRVDRALRSWVDVRFAQAARSQAGGKAQQGNRSAVTGGKHLDGINALVREELTSIAPDVWFDYKQTTLPGYYRPTKSWDLIVFQRDTPILAVEYKSMKGSEGKNLNNRADEVFGVAEDLRQAEKNGLLPATMRRAYVFIMGMTEDSTVPVIPQRVAVGHVDEAFEKASYLQRAALMCERMKNSGLYHMTWAVGVQDDPFRWEEPREAVGWQSFADGLRDMFDDGTVKPMPSSEI